MRLNKFLASGSSLSRRGADAAIEAGRVTVNGQTAVQGMDVSATDVVALDDRAITPAVKSITIMLNKPRGYVVSRWGQGSKTVYDLLPPEYQQLNPVGRLDKDSSGLLLLTNDGLLAQALTHPSRQKTKVYHVVLDKPLQPLHQQMISDHGVMLEDGPSKFLITRRSSEGRLPTSGSTADNRQSETYEIQMHEGRNRQIRRTFAALGYTIQTLHRTQFGPYRLDDLPVGQTRET